MAQATAPGSRVVHVDYTPAVLAHARALLTSNPGALPSGSHLVASQLMLAAPRLQAPEGCTRRYANPELPNQPTGPGVGRKDKRAWWPEG